MARSLPLLNQKSTMLLGWSDLRVDAKGQVFFGADVECIIIGGVFLHGLQMLAGDIFCFSGGHIYLPSSGSSGLIGSVS